jgi:hypothetical protein
MKPFIVYESFLTLMHNAQAINLQFLAYNMKALQEKVRLHQHQFPFNTIWPLGVKKDNGEVTWCIAEIEVERNLRVHLRFYFTTRTKILIKDMMNRNANKLIAPHRNLFEAHGWRMSSLLTRTT